MTTLDLTMAVTVGALFTAGFYLMMQRALMRIVLGFILLGHATNLLLLVAGGGPGEPPIVASGGPGDLDRFADPLPQAMALTAIVITFGLTAFLMALAYRSWRLTGHDEVRDDVEDRLIGTVRDRARTDSAATGSPEGDAAAGERDRGRHAGNAHPDADRGADPDGDRHGGNGEDGR